MLLRLRSSGFIEPCLPSPADRPPSGSNWIHEIKHDGYRLMARRDAAGVRLLTRNGHDWASRFPLIVEAVTALKAGSCLIDGEAVCCDDNGMAVFAKLRQRRNDRHVLLYAFDLLEPTARICGANRWSDARYCWRGCSPGRGQACKLTITSRRRAMWCSSTPARWAWRASCRSGWARAMSRGARATGSR
jgi:hypothetical protein